MSTKNSKELQKMDAYNNLNNKFSIKSQGNDEIQNKEKINLENTDNINKEAFLQILENEKKSLEASRKIQNSKAQSEDLMKVQEFLPENIQPAFEEIKNKDFFEFTDENDKKYDFYKAKYLMRSKTMVKAFYWSMGIGLSMFCHRYYRKQNLKKSIYIGTATMGLSFILVWGNLELNPFMTSFYFSKYIENMARQDYEKMTFYNYIKFQSESLSSHNKINNKDFISYTISMDPCDEIAKYILEIDNQILKNLNSERRNKIDMILKEHKKQEDDEENQDEDESDFDKEIQKNNKRKGYEYDFSELEKNINEGKCKVDIHKFFETEENLCGGLSLIKTLIMLDNKIITDKKETIQLLKYHLNVSDNYLRGFYNDLDFDPDYKLIENIKV